MIVEQARVETARRSSDLPVRGLRAEALARATVLLVEDEHLVREVTREILQAAGYSVLAFPSAADAKRVVGRDDTEIHLSGRCLARPKRTRSGHGSHLSVSANEDSFDFRLP